MAKIIKTYGDSRDVIKVGEFYNDSSEEYIIYANGGNDDMYLHVDGTIDVYGGLGDDHIDVWGSATGTVHGDGGNDIIEHHADDYWDGVLKMYGGTGDDVIVGLAGVADMLLGEEGDDSLRAVFDQSGSYPHELK
jgi:hypothetical protein